MDNYVLTHTLTNLTHGNIEFTIIPDTGYALPSSVTVTNGTLVSYDSTTGIVIISGDDTTVISAECVVPPDHVLNNNSWSTIKSVCEAGNASNYWNVGDTKTDVGTDGVTRTFRIVDMSGLYGKHVVFEQVELEGMNKTQWNPSSNFDSDNAYNNYYISDMRNTHLPATLLKYSSALQGVITTTNVKVATNGNNGTILTLTDKLFLEAEKEVFGSATYSRSDEASALTQYAYYTTHNTAEDRKKRKIGSSSASYWWLRSPYSGDPGRVCVVDGSGSAVSIDASSTRYFAPCFSF